MKLFNEYRNNLVFLLFLIVVFSCVNDKETIYKVCECTANAQENIKSEGGVVALSRDGYKIISIKYGYLTPCVDLPLEYQTEGQIILFSGHLISTCYKEHSGTGLRSLYVEVNDLKKSDTLFQNGPLTITTIHTEDYGKAPGFGYIVNDTKKNFKIIQDQIPGSTKMETFKTKEDALKIAFIVAYRLENFKDFPSVYLGDLWFLKIIEII